MLFGITANDVTCHVGYVAALGRQLERDGEIAVAETITARTDRLDEATNFASWSTHLKENAGAC